jgi:hypothetical protein
LKEILELSDPRCQSCALHGLGHLAHPEAAALVQSYIDRKKDTITADQMKWLEACRDGTVM